MRTVSLSNAVFFFSFVMFFQGVNYSGSPQRSILTLRRSRMFVFLAIQIYNIFFLIKNVFHLTIQHLDFKKR